MEIRIHEQSADISQAVSRAEQGAGDQGIVYGYASDETLNYMPLPIELAHRLTDRLEECRINGYISGLRPDGKSQVSVQYRGDRFDKITSVIVSTQHSETKNLEELTKDIKEKVIGKVLAEYDLTETEILVNPSGRFVLGGFEADTGLTGRKLMVDTYGGIAHHGGGAMSGKDASKVDRSGAYLARYIAKEHRSRRTRRTMRGRTLVCDRRTQADSGGHQYLLYGECEREAHRRSREKGLRFIGRRHDRKTRPPQSRFAQTAVGGHFGKDFFAWELTDKTEALKKAING